MERVLRTFAEPVASRDGVRFFARVCGRELQDGLWEGWLEFEARAEETVLRTERETMQPNRGAVEYWAAGLTPVYLEGALERALKPMERAPESPPARSAPLPGG